MARINRQDAEAMIAARHNEARQPAGDIAQRWAEHQDGEHASDIDVDCPTCRQDAEALGMGDTLPGLLPDGTPHDGADIDEDDPDWDRYERDYKAGIEAVCAIVGGYAEAARRIGSLDEAVVLEGIIDKARRINPMTGEPTTAVR